MPGFAAALRLLKESNFVQTLLKVLQMRRTINQGPLCVYIYIYMQAERWLMHVKDSVVQVSSVNCGNNKMTQLAEVGH